ncbi:hypothetical protein CDAR_381501 [Caerostris darwini]|uniref:Uncharacterized protein n=1 Tax=Caerostris darwini TaxID=1538125 RepID=A0AAV4URA6_9ARAC|nr:hypothetical protein CDAR_381501 [Caerostris darwini]
MNQLTPNASSQMQCSGIYHIDEKPSHFISDCNESDNASTNQLYQHDEMSSGIPILDVQNTQYNSMNTIPTADAINTIQSIPINVQKNFYRKITLNLKIVLVVMRNHVPANIVTKHFLSDRK